MCFMNRRMVSQFHVEQQENKFVKQPDWSLGKYSRTIVVREKGDFLNESAPIVKVSIQT